MATHQATEAVTLVAESAITVSRALEVTSSGTVQHASAQTDAIVGVAAESVAAGDSVGVTLLKGVCEMEAGGTITAGQLVVAAATGTVTGVASLAAVPVDSMAIGVALDGASSGDIFRVLALPLAAPHTA